MKSTKARAIGFVLLIVLILVGVDVGSRLTSDAILVELVTHGALYHPDNPDVADPDGRYRLDADDPSLPSGPEPQGAGDVAIWLADQWPGARLDQMRSLTSGDQELESRLVNFSVEHRGRTALAVLVCVRRDPAQEFRGWVLLFDREPRPGELFSAKLNILTQPQLFQRLRHRIGTRWLVEYQKPSP